jgi:hypothetical protein
MVNRATIETWNQFADSIDWARLAMELATLRKRLRSEPKTAELDADIGLIAAAEIAVLNDERGSCLESAWTGWTVCLDLRQGVGAGVAAAAIQAAIGLR